MIKRRGFLMAAAAVTLTAAMALAGCTSGETYVPQGKDPVVSAPTIGEDGVLRVGVNADNVPLAGMPESTERIVGIDVDVAATIADALGLKLEVVDVGTNPSGALEKGTVDIVMGVDASNTEAAMWKSDIYLPTATAIFSISESAPASGETPQIAAAMSSVSSWAVTNSYGESALVGATSLVEAFDMLESGETPYAAADAINGIYAVNTYGYSSKIVALLEEASGYCVGVLDSNSALKQAISDALKNIVDDGIVSVIESQWLGTKVDLSSYPVIAPTSSAADDAKTANDANAEGDASEGTDAATDTADAADASANATDTSGNASAQ